jgi:hypothetical protein
VNDAGHCILVLLPGSNEPYERRIIPAPVKSVLKHGYTLKNGYVWCDLPYVPYWGLTTDENDREFVFGEDDATGEMITTENDGALIISTNYRTSAYAGAGVCFFSVNAGCIRLLLPETTLFPLGDDVLDGARHAIVSRGTFKGQDGYEVLFEDNSSNPYAIHTLANQWDRPLPRSDSGRTGIPFHVYRNGTVVRKMTARFRMVSRLPYLRPWK